jgi:hypothetical protein
MYSTQARGNERKGESPDDNKNNECDGVTSAKSIGKMTKRLREAVAALNLEKL